ncbi:MAG: putative Ig domain-containing protein [Steroidobacteraceae bacterium]
MTSAVGFGKILLQRAFALLVAVTLSGCLDQGSEQETVDTGLSTDPPAQPAPPPPAQNNPPEIRGTPQADVEAGSSYAFKPEASDADNDFLEFTVTNLPAWAQFNDETGELIGTPTEAHIGETADITITVTDGRETRSIGPFRIRIRPRPITPPPANTPPVISGVPATSVTINQAYSFQPSASDVNGDTLRFSISNRPSWASFSTSTGRLNGTPRSVATYSNIVISVNDGRATVSLPTFAIQVQDVANRAPTISGTPATGVQVSQAYSFQPSASDADGDSLTYSIANRPTWATFSTSTGRLSGTPATAHVGNYANISIRVSDGRATTSLPAFAINVQALPNRAPTISGSPPTTVTVGNAYSFTPSAADPDNDTLGFTIQNRPSWATFTTATGRLSGTPTSANVGSYTGIVISVGDGKVTTSLPAFTLTVQAGANNAPTISGNPPTSVVAAAAYSFQANGADQDGDPLTYSIQNRPSWANFNTNTGLLSGTPTTAQAGTYANIVISVSDGTDSASLAAFSITVTQPVTGSATLSWTPPTQNTDGSTITNLAGYRINYGTSSGQLNQIIEISNPGMATYVVNGLNAGNWFFAVRAYNNAGAESVISNVASKTIQ